MVNVVNETKVAEPWYKSKTFWTFIVGEIGITQVAYEAWAKGAPIATAFFGWLAASAVLVQNVFLRQTTVDTATNSTSTLKETIREEAVMAASGTTPNETP